MDHNCKKMKGQVCNSTEQQADVLQKQGPMLSAFGNLSYQRTVKGPVDAEILIDLLLGTSVQSFQTN